MRARRGITPIFAVVILIGIAVVGGAFLSSAQTQLLNTSLTDLEYRVTDLRLEKDSGGTCFFSAKLYNSGTEPISKTVIHTTFDSGEQWSPQDPNLTSTIQPTNSTKVFVPFTGNPCGNVTVSNTYSVGIEAHSASSSYKTVQQLKAREIS
jgi:flagellin-like protein